MTVGLNPESNQLEAWGFITNGIRARGKIFSNGKTLRFVFTGKDSEGVDRKATFELTREGDSKRHQAGYTKLSANGQDILPPPATSHSGCSPGRLKTAWSQTPASWAGFGSTRHACSSLGTEDPTATPRMVQSDWYAAHCSLLSPRQYTGCRQSLFPNDKDVI
jgi:hypothetical protein